MAVELDGVTLGVDNLSALMRASQVLVTEGERAVDRLSALDFAATCPPAGASKWDDQWSALLCELGCAEVVVLADADRAGQRHAERVALSRLPARRPTQALVPTPWSTDSRRRPTTREDRRSRPTGQTSRLARPARGR